MAGYFLRLFFCLTRKKTFEMINVKIVFICKSVGGASPDIYVVSIESQWPHLWEIQQVEI